MADQPGFFDLDERLAQLSRAGDPLERLSAVVDFELFRPALDAALSRSDRSKGGQPPKDAVIMFKVLVLQALYGISDEQAEYQIGDRLSFMRFLGLGLGDRVPDRTTIWLYRERLTRAGAIDALFERFDAALKDQGYFALGGQIMDASIVEAPRQRNTDGEKAAIKQGKSADEIWPDDPHKARQKDTEARWTLKRGRVKPKPGREGLEGQKPDTSERMAEGLVIPAFGYKSHINIDRRHGLIRRWTVTNAAAHDGARLPGLLDPDAFGAKVWADTAYRSKKNEKTLERAGRVSMIHFKKPKGRPMPGPQQRANRARSKVRTHVEHVFGAQKTTLGLVIRTVGLARAKTKIGMVNLVYNMRRLVWLSQKPAPA